MNYTIRIQGINPYKQYDQPPVATLVDLIILIGIIILVFGIIHIVPKIKKHITKEK